MRLVPSALILSSKSSISYTSMTQRTHAGSDHSTSQPSEALEAVTHRSDSSVGTHLNRHWEIDVKQAVLLLCSLVLAGCAISAPPKPSPRPLYLVGDCYRHSTANQRDIVGQIQMVKDAQYHIAVLAEGSITFSYSDWIPIARLEQISSPAPCPSGTPSPIPLNVQSIERNEPKK